MRSPTKYVSHYDEGSPVAAAKKPKRPEPVLIVIDTRINQPKSSEKPRPVSASRIRTGKQDPNQLVPDLPLPQEIPVITNLGGPVTRIHEENIDDRSTASGSVQSKQSNKSNPSKPRAQSADRSRSVNKVANVSFNRVSNQQSVKNALTSVCLAGAHHDIPRNEAIQAIDHAFIHGVFLRDEDPTITVVNQFVILFQSSKSLSFRGIYAVVPMSDDLIRIYGKGPKLIKVSQIDAFFKYSSSSRSFVDIPSKSITNTTDAISIDTKMKR